MRTTELLCPIINCDKPEWYPHFKNQYLPLSRILRGNKLLTLISGFFCPIHGGHIDYITQSSKFGDYLVVVVNSDEQWKRKKNKDEVWMKQEERAKIIASIRCVDCVIIWNQEDLTISRLFDFIDVDIFINGGDRNSMDKSVGVETQICIDKGIMLGFIGKKTNSSSSLLEKM